MAAEASIVRRYENADRNDRICMMLENYASFDTLIDIEMAGIEYRVKEERAYRKRRGVGDLGVRVQTSGRSNPTEARAIESLEIEKAINSHDFNNIIFKDVEGMDEIRQDIYVLEIMRMDFDAFKKQVMRLKPIDRRILLRIIDDGVDCYTVADEEVIAYEAVRSRVKRAKLKIRDNMFIFWDDHQRRGL